MQLDKESFAAYTERVLEQIELLHQKFDKLVSAKTEKDIKLFDNQDLCQLLNVDKRTLQRYRSKGTLKYVRLGGKTFYTAKDVNEFIKQHD